MSTNNKVITKFEIAETEIEETMKMKLDEFKSETSSSVDMKLLTLSSDKYTSSYEKPSSDLIKWSLFKSP